VAGCNHDEQWAVWCRGIAQECVLELADECGSAVGELERDLAALRDEVAQIRADIMVERAVRDGGSVVVDLPDFLRRKRNAS
jgi:uncharacterized small protein (DUF1192 family)